MVTIDGTVRPGRECSRAKATFGHASLIFLDCNGIIPGRGDPLKPTQRELSSSESWSIEYAGVPCADARLFNGQWYCCDPITKNFELLLYQDRVVPLSRNARPARNHS